MSRRGIPHYVLGRLFPSKRLALAWAQTQADMSGQLVTVSRECPEDFRSAKGKTVKPRGCECKHCGEFLTLDFLETALNQ